MAVKPSIEVMVNIDNHQVAAHKLQTMTSQFVELMLLKVQEEQNIEQSIIIAEWVARFLSMNNCGIYRLDALEEAISRRLPEPVIQASNKRKTELHIATEIYHYGGHTRLIQALLNSNNFSADVLLTRGGGDKMAAILDIPNGELISLKATTGVEQACEIMEIVSGYGNVFVHIHPDDVITAAALQKIWKVESHPKIIFVNHADHIFSVGIGSADIVFEISSYGWGLRGKRGIESISSFIGIPIQLGDYDLKIPAKRGLILSAAASYKFKPQGAVTLPRILLQVLKSNGDFTIVIMGPSWRDYWWWPLKFRFPGRVKIKSQVPYKSYLKYLESCSVYLDSYPLTGGTAFTEALIKGCNVAGIVGSVSGYGLADELKSKNILDLCEFISKIINNDFETIRQQKIARVRASVFHSIMAVRERITETMKIGVLLQPPLINIDLPKEPWFDCLWKKNNKLVVPGFRSSKQMRIVFPVILIQLFVSFNPLRVPMVQLLSKAAYAIFRRSI